MLFLRFNTKLPKLVYNKSLIEKDSTRKGKSIVAKDMPRTMLGSYLGVLCLLVKLSTITA